MYRNRFLALFALALGLRILWSARHHVEAPPADLGGVFSYIHQTNDVAVVLLGLLFPLVAALMVYLFLVTMAETLASAVGLVRVSSLFGTIAPTFWRKFVLRPFSVGAIALPTMFLGVAGAESADSAPASFSQATPITMVLVSGTATSSLSEAPVLSMTQTRNTTYTVQTGDSLWHIAEQHLTQRLGLEPSLSSIRSYWLELIDENLDRLPDSSNPSLIFVGTELVLPEITA